MSSFSETRPSLDKTRREMISLPVSAEGQVVEEEPSQDATGMEVTGLKFAGTVTVLVTYELVFAEEHATYPAALMASA